MNMTLDELLDVQEFLTIRGTMEDYYHKKYEDELKAKQGTHR